MIKMLFKRVREYKTASILCPIVMVGEAVMEIIIPFLMTFIVGELEDLAKGKIDTVNGGKIALFASLMIVCAFAALFFGVVGARLAAKASCGFAHNLREDMYNNIQSFSFANIDNYSTFLLSSKANKGLTLGSTSLIFNEKQ